MNKNNRIITIAAAVIVGIGGIGFVANAASADSWQGELRSSLQADWDTMTEAEEAEGCGALQMFGITDAQAFADFAVDMGITATDITEDTDIDPASITDVHEAALIAGEVLVENCDF